MESVYAGWLSVLIPERSAASKKTKTKLDGVRDSCNGNVLKLSPGVDSSVGSQS